MTTPTKPSKGATIKAAVIRFVRIFGWTFLASIKLLPTGSTKDAYVAAAVAAAESAFRVVVPNVGVFASRMVALFTKYAPTAAVAVNTIDPALAPEVKT